jgi:hypothetical protein
MVGGERTVIRHAGTMLQELAQRMAPARKRGVEREPPGIDENERGGSKHGLGEAPPRDRSIRDIAGGQRPVHHGRGHHLHVGPLRAADTRHRSSPGVV